MPGNGVRPMAAPKGAVAANERRQDDPGSTGQDELASCAPASMKCVWCPDHLHDGCHRNTHGFDEPASLKERDEQDLPVPTPKVSGKARPRQLEQMTNISKNVRISKMRTARPDMQHETANGRRFPLLRFHQFGLVDVIPGQGDVDAS